MDSRRTEGVENEERDISRFRTGEKPYGWRSGSPVLRTWSSLPGKGHEDYQIIGTKKFPFDDRVEVKRALEEV